MKNLLIGFILSFISIHTIAQEVTVIDQKTNLPIENVAVYNLEKSKSAISNENGKIDISIFSANEYLTFQHSAFKEYTIQKNALNTNTILMSEQIVQMNDVLISANKWEQDVDEIPNEIVSISANEIAFNNPQTSADMLSQTGQVFMQKSQFGGGSPKLRGFAANSVLIVIDGVRMNNAIYRSGNLQNIISVDPNTLDGAEVILGPGSVIYGSDALGGVMDFHVKDTKYSSNDKLRTSVTALSRYSSAANERTLHTNFGIGGKKIAWFSSISYSNLGDLKAGESRPDDYETFGKKDFLVAKDLVGNDILIANSNPNTQSPSGFESWNTIQKIGFKASENINFNYNFYLSNTSNIPRYDRLIEVDETGSPNDSEWYYGPQKWIMNSLKTTLTKPTFLFNQAKAIIAYQDYEESRNDRGFGDDRLRTRTEEVDIWSVNIDFDKQLKNSSLFYGLEYLYNDVKSSGFRENQMTGEITPTSSRYPNGGSEYVSYAAYLNYKWNISTAWILNTGLRYSHVKLNAKFNDTDGSLDFPFDQFDLDNGALNGSLGLVYNPNDKIKANIALSSGFRSPNIDDVGKVFDFSDGEVQVPNTQLEPEYAYNIETGLEVRITDNIEVGGTIFYTLVDNAMVRRDFTFNGQDSILFEGELSKVVALTNTGEAEIYGYSFELEAMINDNWAIDATVTNTFGEDKTNNIPLRHTTPLFGKVSLLYQKNKLRTELYSEFNGNRFRGDIPPSEIDDKPFLYAKHKTDASKDGSPGWFTLNAKGSYQINQNFSLSGGVENIFDKHYRPYSSGISASGRNFILSVKAKF